MMELLACDGGSRRCRAGVHIQPVASNVLRANIRPVAACRLRRCVILLSWMMMRPLLLFGLRSCLAKAHGRQQLSLSAAPACATPFFSTCTHTQLTVSHHHPLQVKQRGQ